MKRLALMSIVVLLVAPVVAQATCDGADNCLGIYFDQGQWTQTCVEPVLFTPFHIYFVLQNCTFEAIGGIEFGWRYAPPPSPTPIITSAVFFGPGPCFGPLYNIIYGMGAPIPIDGPVVIVDFTLILTAPVVTEIQFGPATPASLPGHAAINDWYHPENIVPLDFGAPVDGDGWTIEGVAKLGDCPVPVESAAWSDVKALFK